MGQSLTASPPTEKVSSNNLANTQIGVREAWLNTIIGLNDGEDMFKYKFSCEFERIRFQKILRGLDRFLFDFDTNLQYITVTLKKDLVKGKELKDELF